MTLSLVIRNGLVYDGLGNPPQRVDVGIEGDRIAVVGVVAETGASEIDASGLAVSPGFINVLSHAWQSIQVDGSCPSDLLQGVTTEVFGEAVSLGPSSQALVDIVHARTVAEGMRIDFARLCDGLQHLQDKGISVNVASFIGGHNLRAMAAGLDSRALTAEEIAELQAVVEEEMQQGALGIGTALIYAPGSYATTDELVALCEPVGRHDGLYISHMRSEGDQLLECLEELITIGQRAGCRTEVYHLKAAGAHNHHKMALAIERIETARAAGQDVTADMYPYTAGGTALAASIPPKYHDGGIELLLKRLDDDSTRAEVIAALKAPSDTFENLFRGAERVLLLKDLSDGTPTEGKDLSEVASLLGLNDLAETLVEVVRRDHTVLACYFMMSEENVELGLRQPWVSIGSDAEATRPGAVTTASGHPRAYGAFAKVLGHYSRDHALFPLEEAIRKMTSSPADTLRLKDRGRIVVGALADLAVFDPASVQDLATYEDPKQFATGMRHVVVNGVPVLADGEILGARPGRRLRRGA